MADFEEPKHAELVGLDNPSGKSRFELSYRKGRAETGSTGIVFHAASVQDTLVLSSSNARQWYMKRDWRDYDLLLMSLRSPSPDVVINVAITGGGRESQKSANASIPLNHGWNTLRIDLAEIGERIPLDDVREIRLAASEKTAPAEFQLDDVLLAGNQVDLLGDSTGSDSRLYVHRIGRRWRVGAKTEHSGFEITFANGQITEWFDPAKDPHRLNNLVPGESLTPTPVIMMDSGGISTDFSALGESLSVRPRIVEMNAVRVVIRSEWRFRNEVRSEERSLETRPFQRWTYTIYSTGQVYVLIEATSSAPDWRDRHLGLALSTSGDGQDRFAVDPAGTTASLSTAQPTSYALLSDAADHVSVLYVVSDAENNTKLSESQVGSAKYLVATRPASKEPTESWNCQIVLRSGVDAKHEASSGQAMEYLNGAPPRMLVGGSDETGETTSKGAVFDPTSGVWNIQADGPRVRFVIDGSKQPRYSPAFRIVNARRRDAWVYVNQVLLPRTAHDQNGDLIFQIPDCVRDATVVEVLFKGP